MKVLRLNDLTEEQRKELAQIIRNMFAMTGVILESSDNELICWLLQNVNSMNLFFQQQEEINAQKRNSQN